MSTINLATLFIAVGAFACSAAATVKRPNMLSEGIGWAGAFSGLTGFGLVCFHLLTAV